MSALFALFSAVVVMALPTVLAITLHEAAHGYAALHFGDTTARDRGRISLNPLVHIDPVGTVLLPLGILALHHFVGGPLMLFGWAKPVPVNIARLRRPKQDMLWVAAAGPLANLAMGLGWAALLHLAQGASSATAAGIGSMALHGLEVNVMLMVLNLFPLPPLDGGRIVTSLLPVPLAGRFAMIERWGFPILLLLLYTGMLQAILGPFLDLAFNAIALLFDLK